MGENWINANVFNAKLANKWNDVYLHLSGVVQYVSGSGPQISKVLSGGVIYEVISKNPCHMVAGTGSLLSASVGSKYVPADVYVYHIPVSGTSDRISIINAASSTVVEAWISPAESLK